MSKNDFMKQVSKFNMPDISEVKKTCNQQLNTDNKKQLLNVKFNRVAILTVIIVCLWIMPVNSLAKNVIQHIKTILSLDDESIELGNVDEVNIRIPDDCEVVKNDGVTYLSKAYHTLSDLMKDIQTDFYTWKGTDKFLDNGIMLNIVQNDYGRISLLYDITQGNIINEDVDHVDLQSVDLFVYFPLSSETSLGDIMLKNEQLKYGTIDDEGDIEKYQQNTEYELVEQYESGDLDTAITIISSKTDTNEDGDLGKATESNTLYYIYFTLDGMCYQINCVGTIDKAHDILKNMKKSNVKKTVQSSINSGMYSDDLIYRETDGSSVSLEKGEKINISVPDKEEYDDVYISLIGKDMTERIGLLNINMSYTYSVTVSGEYVIYAGKNNANITDKINVEHLCNAENNFYLLD